MVFIIVGRVVRDPARSDAAQDVMIEVWRLAALRPGSGFGEGLGRHPRPAHDVIVHTVDLAICQAVEFVPGGPASTVGTYSSSWSLPSNVRLDTISRATSGYPS
jgi:hypothetical protein